MTDPTLLITVSRLLVPGSPDPLVFSGALDSNELGVVDYQQPASQNRVTYTQDSVDVHGSIPIASALQQAMLGWDWVADTSMTETEVQAHRKEVEAALAQFTYTVTTQVSDAPGEIWTANPGSQVPSSRSYEDLLAPGSAVFAVTVPVYPIPGA